MSKRFVVWIPELEWEPAHKTLEHMAEVRVGSPGTRYTEDRLIAGIGDVDALIITSQHAVTNRVLEAAERLKVVAKYGSKPGTDNVDLDAATAHGVVVCYTPCANADSVAEHTIVLVLALLKRLWQTSTRLKAGQWRDLSLLGQELRGRMVGIIGFGTVGRKVAHKLTGFGVHLLVCDPFVSDDDVEPANAQLVDLAKLMSEADIVTIHAILNESTVNLVGEKELRRCKRSAYVVNTSRGAIVDEAALIKALREGWIAGAAVDVFTEEPPRVDNPLLHMDNVLVTPHFASCTEDAFRRETETAMDEVRRVLKGKIPRYVANPEVLSRLDLR